MNKTFHANRIHFNACVGNNGGIDFETYALGYLDSVKAIMVAVLNHDAILDTIVFPLVYSARHYIELIIKHQLRGLAIIQGFINANHTYNLLATHEISTLWKVYELNTLFDKRYSPLVEKAKSYIDDFVQIDDNGEAFRYPYSKENNQNLIELYCIDVFDFWQRFEKLSEHLTELNDLTKELVSEYYQGSFLCGKSRKEIKEIAEMLPPINEWKSDVFEFKKEEIRKQYGLSSNQLSKVVSFIKSHREFSALIDNEIVLNELSPKDLSWFIKTYDYFLVIRNKKSYLDCVNEMITKISRRFKKETIASIAQIYEIGYFFLYSEEYDKGFELKMKKQKADLIWSYFLQNGLVKMNIIRGLKSMGQKTLLAEIT